MGKPSPLDPRQQRFITRSLANGMSVKEIAWQLGFPSTTVYNWLSSQGLSSKDFKVKPPPKLICEVSPTLDRALSQHANAMGLTRSEAAIKILNQTFGVLNNV